MGMVPLGVLSLYVFHEPIASYNILPTERLLLDIISDPQRPQPNAIIMTVSVRDVIVRHNEKLGSIPHALTGKLLHCKGVEVPWRNSSGLKIGDTVLADLRVRSLSPVRSPLSYESTLRRRGIAAQCVLKNVVRVSRVRQTQTTYEQLMGWMGSYPGYELEGGLFASLLFGYRTGLSNIIEDQFKRTGLSHLLVFSGAQVAILYISLYAAVYAGTVGVMYLAKIYRGVGVSRYIALFLTVFFVLLVGSDKTTIRALIAAVASVSAAQFERHSSVLWGMGISAFALSIFWPGCMLEPGMHLTFAALFGIWMGLLQRSFLWGCIYTSFATSCVSMLWFETFSIIGFLINPIIVPVVSFGTTMIGLPALIGTLLHVPFSRLALELLFQGLTLLERAVYYCSLREWSALNLDPLVAKVCGVVGLSFLIFVALRLKGGHTNAKKAQK